MLTARMDGGCSKNPGGHGASACFITRDEKEIYRASRYIGFGPGMTNNVAEFYAIRMIFEWIEKNPSDERFHIISDSQIVINRMSGKSRKAPVGTCADIALKCQAALTHLAKINPNRRITFEWQKRFRNDVCDAMCSQKIREASKVSKPSHFVPTPEKNQGSFTYGWEDLS